MLPGTAALTENTRQQHERRYLVRRSVMLGRLYGSVRAFVGLSGSAGYRRGPKALED